MRNTLLVAVVAIIWAVIVPADVALANPLNDSGNPSCFGQIARADATLPGGTGGPGNVVGEVASALGQSGEAGAVASTLVRPLQQARNEGCPTTLPIS